MTFEEKDAAAVKLVEIVREISESGGAADYRAKVGRVKIGGTVVLAQLLAEKTIDGERMVACVPIDGDASVRFVPVADVLKF